MREFFEQMEKRYGATLPVHKLGWPDYWTDGVASTAFETGLNRIAHNEILTAEKVSAIAAKIDPAGDVRVPGRRDPGRARVVDALRRAHLGRLQLDRRSPGRSWPAASGPRRAASPMTPGRRRGRSSGAGPKRWSGSSTPAAPTSSPSSTRSPGRRTDVVRMALPAGPVARGQGEAPGHRPAQRERSQVPASGRRRPPRSGQGHPGLGLRRLRRRDRRGRRGRRHDREAGGRRTGRAGSRTDSIGSRSIPRRAASPASSTRSSAASSSTGPAPGRSTPTSTSSPKAGGRPSTT